MVKVGQILFVLGVCYMLYSQEQRIAQLQEQMAATQEAVVFVWDVMQAFGEQYNGR